MEKVGAIENLRLKEHTHTFINQGGRVGELDFRFPTGAPFNGLKAFLPLLNSQRWIRLPIL